MSDYNSSLPIRTENNGDAAVKIVDGTITSQALNVDSSGRVTTKLDDGNGNIITSQANGGQRALDVGINVSGTQIDPRQVRALTSSDVVTANQGSANTIGNAWPVKPTDGTNSQSFTAAGEAKVTVTQPLPAGTNAIGSVTVNNASGASAVNIQDGGNSITVDGTVSASNLPSTVDTNFGTVGASTLRTAAEMGNSTGAADFNNGATSAQTLRVAANLAISGANVSATNPIPVVLSADPSGNEINDYNTAAAIAAGSSSNHDYTVTAGKTLLLRQLESTASGKAKIEVQIESGVATGIFATKFVQFNSTATPNMHIEIVSPTSVAAGVRVRVIRTNKDNQAQDLYSTISGEEV